MSQAKLENGLNPGNDTVLSFPFLPVLLNPN